MAALLAGSAKVQLALRNVTRLLIAPVPPPVTLTDVPVPVAGSTGAGSVAWSLLTVRCDIGMVWAPLDSGVVTVAYSRTCPALLRTSTGSTLPLAVTLNAGTAPLQFTAWLLPLVGVVGAAGMLGLTTKLAVLTVSDGYGQADPAYGAQGYPVAPAPVAGYPLPPAYPAAGEASGVVTAPPVAYDGAYPYPAPSYPQPYPAAYPQPYPAPVYGPPPGYAYPAAPVYVRPAPVYVAPVGVNLSIGGVIGGGHHHRRRGGGWGVGIGF